MVCNGSRVLQLKVLFTPYIFRQGCHGCQAFVLVQDHVVDYLVDHASLKPLPDDDHWLKKANNRINNIRKSNITIR